MYLRSFTLARRVVAQQEVETIAGWLHPSSLQNFQEAAEVRSYTLRMQQGMVNCYPAMIGGSRGPHFSQQVAGTRSFYGGGLEGRLSGIENTLGWLVALVLSRFLFQSRPEEYCVILNRT